MRLKLEVNPLTTMRGALYFLTAEVFGQKVFKVLYINEAGKHCLATKLLSPPYGGRVYSKKPAFLPFLGTWDISLFRTIHMTLRKGKSPTFLILMSFNSHTLLGVPAT